VYHDEYREQRDVITRPVFDVLHAALCEGHSFDHACLLACEKYPAPTPIVTAENLYAPDAQGEPAPNTATGGEPDPNKVREGYIPNPYLKGPFPLKRADDVASLDDPNPDAHGGFTVEEATRELGLTDAAVLLTAIHHDAFPAVKIDGKWTLTRADLKRIRALRDEGLTVEEAVKRAGAPTVDSPTVPNEGSWTDHLAPLTPDEAAEVADLTPEEQIEDRWQKEKSSGGVGDARVPATDEKVPPFYPPPPAEVRVSSADERQWALEALGEGVFTVEQALKIAGVTDNPRNRWALTLLGRGDITLAQAARLLK
jgi:hypothetical protein